MGPNTVLHVHSIIQYEFWCFSPQLLAVLLVYVSVCMTAVF